MISKVHPDRIPSWIPWIPAVSFALAILLSFAAGPARRAIGRGSGRTTACNHTFTANIPQQKCLESETSKSPDAPANCQNVVPSGGSH